MKTFWHYTRIALAVVVVTVAVCIGIVRTFEKAYGG